MVCRLVGAKPAIIYINAGILLIEPLGINFSEILIKIRTFRIQENEFANVVCKMAANLSRPQTVHILCPLRAQSSDEYWYTCVIVCFSLSLWNVTSGPFY